MLQITVPLAEGFDEETNEFVDVESVVLQLEHSLVSLSKWESKHEKPFLGYDKKTSEQTLDYIKMMVLTENVPETVFNHLSEDNIKQINAYIASKQTATWFSEAKKDDPAKQQEIITAEIIYYWMVALGIDFEAQYWHLNRLLTLVRVCNIKNAPKEKMTKADRLAQQRALNEQRRAQYHTKG